MLRRSWYFMKMVGPVGLEPTTNRLRGSWRPRSGYLTGVSDVTGYINVCQISLLPRSKLLSQQGLQGCNLLLLLIELILL